MEGASGLLFALHCFTTHGDYLTTEMCRKSGCPYVGMDCEIAVLEDSEKLIRKYRKQIKRLKYKLYVKHEKG